MLFGPREAEKDQFTGSNWDQCSLQTCGDASESSECS